MEDSEQKRKDAEALFRAKAVTDPKRQTGAIPPDAKHAKGLSESEDDNLPSDLQASLKRLFPKFPIRSLNMMASAVMVGRVSPDTMLDRVYLTATAIIENWDDEEDGELDVMLVINVTLTAFEIGLDSKGRVEVVELHGAEESKELEKLASSMTGVP